MRGKNTQAMRQLLKYTQLLLLALHLVSCNQVSKEKQREVVIIDDGVTFTSDQSEKLFLLGREYSDSGKYDSATFYYYQALAIDSNNPRILNSIGVLENEKKNYSIAIKYFNKAISKDKNYFNSYLNLSLLYHDIKEYEKGIEACNYVIRNSSNDLVKGIGYYHKAIILFSLNKCADSKDNLRKAKHYLKEKILAK